jgi:lipopolysaccharide exporter
MRSLADQAVRAVNWSIGISIATVSVQLVITAVVARLLEPADFGVYAIASVAYMLMIPVNVGLSMSLAREPSLDSDVIGSALLLSGSVSVVLACAVFLAAPWVGGFGENREESELARVLIQLMAARILLAGIGSPAQALMERELRFRDLGLIQFGGYLIGTGGITVALARAGLGPNSLVWGDIANSAIVTGTCWWFTRGRWPTSCNAAHVLRIGRIGWQLTALSVLDLLWTQLPLVVAKAYLGPSPVGLYQRSQTLVNIGIQYTTARVSMVLYPAMAARQDRSVFLRNVIPPLVGLYSMFLFAAAAFVAVTASDIVLVLLGPAWADAARIIPWVMIAFVVLHVSQPVSIQLEALALFRPRVLSSSCGVVGFLLVSLFLVRPYGLQGIAAAAVLSGATTTLINFVAVVHYLRVNPLDLASWMIPSASMAFVLSFVLEILYHYLVLSISSPLFRLLIMAGLGTGIALSGFRLLLGRKRRHVLSLYISEDIPRFAGAIAKLFGLDLAKQEHLKEGVTG